MRALGCPLPNMVLLLPRLLLLPSPLLVMWRVRQQPVCSLQPKYAMMCPVPDALPCSSFLPSFLQTRCA